MKVTKFDTEEEWMDARRCKITGSRLGDIISKKDADKKKIGFYELIAERIGLPATEENPMDRGHRLELEAIERFESVTGKKVDPSLVIWTRDDNEDIAVSPDGTIGKNATEAVEAKCLSSARHIEALLKQQVPTDYEMQVLQYFIVNEKLETLYFCFYDPRLKVKDFFFLEITREMVSHDVAKYLEQQRKTLEEVEEIVNELTAF